MSWAFIVLQGEWRRLRLWIVLLSLLVVALLGTAVALALGGYDPEAGRCIPPFPELRETWELDHPECVGQP